MGHFWTYFRFHKIQESVHYPKQPLDAKVNLIRRHLKPIFFKKMGYIAQSSALITVYCFRKIENIQLISFAVS